MLFSPIILIYTKEIAYTKLRSIHKYAKTLEKQRHRLLLYRVEIRQLPRIKYEGGVQMPEVEIGKVSDFFARPVVAGIQLTAPLKQGDRIHITGHTTDMELTVDSMQINNVDVSEAKAGDAIGVKVSDRVRRGDTVYKVTD